jgi:hypothetical protein
MPTPESIGIRFQSGLDGLLCDDPLLIWPKQVLEIRAILRPFLLIFTDGRAFYSHGVARAILFRVASWSRR